jgi:hypothetical protein
MFLLSAKMAVAAAYQVDPSLSVFAIITHKAGFAAQMAHNHMVFADHYDILIDADEKRLEDARFEFKAPVSGLINDLDPVSQKWSDRFKALDILPVPFVLVSESDRSSIRQSMLGDSQLDEKQFPTITLTLVNIQNESSVVGSTTFTHKAKVKLNIHGHDVERWVPANISFGNGVMQVEVAARLRFTEFGIKPFSAFFGAFRNQDEFDLYANFIAKPTLI